MRRFFVILFVVSVVLASCESGGSYLPGYSGKSGEIILVIDENHFNECEETVNQTIGKYQHGLPQAERQFSIVNIPHKSFTQIFKINRNIIIADIAKGKPNKVEVKKSMWAKGQLVVTISAENTEKFNQLLTENSEQLTFRFQNIELSRLNERNQKFGFEKELTGHKLKLIFQEDAGLAVDSAGFVWIRIERERPVGGTMHQISQGVLVYYTPYTDTSQFSQQELLALKDSITQKYIPGPKPGSFMTTNYKYILPDSKPIRFKGQYGVRTTGLWKMENGHMGGPFVSITTLDEKNSRLVTVEGFVFAPQFEKREFLREVEAIMHSVEFL